MKRFSKFLALALLVSFFAGCAGDDGGTTNNNGNSGSSNSGGDSTENSGGNGSEAPDTITIASQLDFSILDPFNTGSSADAAVNYNIFDSLLNMDVYGNYYPLVAKDWKVSEDGLRYTFYLRDDVTFHNGTPLTAHDVVYSAERMKPSPFKARTTAIYSHAEYIDDYTVDFILHEKSATFLFEIAQNFVVYNEEATEALGDDFKENPIGCGPYEFVSMTPGEGVVVKAYQDYYDGVAPIENLIYKVIPDASTALVALENGEVDVCNYVPASSYSIVESNSDLYLLRTPFTRCFYLILNMEEEPFKDNVLVRQAIAHAVDKQAIIDVAIEGYGTLADALVNDRFVAYPPNVADYGRDYDPEKAAELLAEAGYENGEGLPVIQLHTIEMFKKQVEMVQAFLKDIGIESEVNLLELSTYLDMQANGELHVGVMSSTLGGDASVYAALLTEGGAYNGAQYYDEEMEELFLEAGQELDEEKRIALYERIYIKEIEDMPYVPLYFPDTVTCGRADLDFEEIMDYLCYKGNFYKFK